MKRVLGLVFVLVFVLVGCGGGSNDDPTDRWDAARWDQAAWR